MSWILSFLLFFSSLIISNAQIPLSYQLLQAYYPSTLEPSSPSAQILGIASTSPGLPVSPPTSTPSPHQIGGDGRVVTIALLGDSMIDTLGTELNHLQNSLSEIYPQTKFNLINFGQGGNNVEDGFKRLPLLFPKRPDIVVIESFAYNNFGNSSDGLNRHWLGLESLVNSLKSNLPQTKILLAATIAPNSVIFANGIKDAHFSALEKIEKSNTIKLYLENLIAFSASAKLPLADAYHPSLVSSEGNRNFISTTDNLHPSDYGNQFFCQTLARAISDNRLIN